MKLHSSFIKGLGFFSLGVMFVGAQEGGQPKGPPPGGDGASKIAEFMKRADADGDGKISKEEFATMSRKETDERFSRADGNGDGFIDQSEFGQITQRMRDGGMRRPSGEGGPPTARPGGDGDGGFRRPPGAPEGRGPGASPPPGGPDAGRPGFGGGPGGAGGQGARPGMGMLGDPKEAFKRMDADANGSVSEEEYVAAMNRFREMMGNRGMPGGPSGGPNGAGGFRRPGAEGGTSGGAGEGGFRRPPVEEGKPEAKPEGDKPAADKPKDAA